MTICVSNIYARSQLDIQVRLHVIGITIIQEVPAHFEVHYSGKLHIQSTSLTVKVCSDQKLLDLLQGRRHRWKTSSTQPQSHFQMMILIRYTRRNLSPTSKSWTAESATLANPDGPVNLLTWVPKINVGIEGISYCRARHQLFPTIHGTPWPWFHLSLTSIDYTPRLDWKIH